MTTSGTAKPLNHIQREQDLSRLSEEVFDILVIGGGVTGAGVALDAAGRRLKVGLLEQRDYASGTSSRSSKLFHGGLRYLEQMNFALVREALAERNLMLRRLCPHLARPVSFVYPLRHRIWERLYVGAGVLLYDLLAAVARSPLPRHNHLGRQGLERLAPALRSDAAVGGVRYWDAQVDDARHTMMVARTAATLGAAVATSTRVTGFIEEGGRIAGVEAVDLERGLEFGVRAHKVINAAGVWSDDIQALAGSSGLDVSASKGVHIVVPKDRISSSTGLILRTKKSVLFVIPFDDHWIVGTTDTPWALGRAHPAASRADIDYILRWVNTVLSPALTAEDIVGVFAGLRPLLSGERDDTSKLSREHAVLESSNGLVSVAGGKYTTYRIMARDAVDRAVSDFGASVPSSRSERIPIVGADTDTGDHHPRLLHRYGSLAAEVTGLSAAEPALGSRLLATTPYTRAEIRYGVTHEGALHLDDVLTRRTRISIETRDRGREAAPLVAEIMQEVLGWSESDRAREVAHYLARVDAELDSQDQEDDHTADAARMGAPDVRTGTSE